MVRILMKSFACVSYRSHQSTMKITLGSNEFSVGGDIRNFTGPRSDSTFYLFNLSQQLVTN